MTTTAPEVAQQTAQDLTPAQQAMAVAVVFALAAEAGSEQRVLAWLAGRITRVDACYAVAQQVLQAVAKATLAGEHFAQIEQNRRVRPKIISSTEHERLVRALDSITREAEQVRATDLAASVRRTAVTIVTPEQLDDRPTEPEDDHETEPGVVMRVKRLARAEVIRAGRTSFGEAVDQAIGTDPDYIWRFEPSAGACGRCLELARLRFDNYQDAPPDGAHPSCSCVLSAELREE